MGEFGFLLVADVATFRDDREITNATWLANPPAGYIHDDEILPALPILLDSLSRFVVSAVGRNQD